MLCFSYITNVHLSLFKLGVITHGTSFEGFHFQKANSHIFQGKANEKTHIKNSRENVKNSLHAMGGVDQGLKPTECLKSSIPAVSNTEEINPIERSVLRACLCARSKITSDEINQTYSKTKFINSLVCLGQEVERSYVKWIHQVGIDPTSWCSLVLCYFSTSSLLIISKQRKDRFC